MTHPDPLLARYRRAAIESRLLKLERRHLRAELQRARELLRVLILESASLRAEASSVREEMIYRRSVSPLPPLPTLRRADGPDAPEAVLELDGAAGSTSSG